MPIVPNSVLWQLPSHTLLLYNIMPTYTATYTLYCYLLYYCNHTTTLLCTRIILYLLYCSDTYCTWNAVLLSLRELECYLCFSTIKVLHTMYSTTVTTLLLCYLLYLKCGATLSMWTTVLPTLLQCYLLYGKWSPTYSLWSTITPTLHKLQSNLLYLSVLYFLLYNKSYN